MKVAIVYPEVYDIARFGEKRKEFPPFGALYLSTILVAQNGLEVEVVCVTSDQERLDFTGFDVGINVKAFIIHGYPGENAETTRETIELLERFRAKIDGVSLFRFVPLPGSYVYNNASAYQLRIEKNSWSKSHIHHNPYHWWGSDRDFSVLEEAYANLDNFIQEEWG